MVACETKLDLIPGNTKTRLVVNALINDQDQIEIQVSKTIALGSSASVEFLNNAQVVVRDESGKSYPFVFNVGTDKYYYPAGLVAQAGKYYSVSVSVNGLDEVFSELVMPSKATTAKAVWKDSTDLDSSGYPTGTLTIKLLDRGDEPNYYRVGLYYYDPVTAYWNMLKPVTTDAAIDNEAIKSEKGTWVFSDRTFNGQNKSIAFITPFGYASGSPKYLVVTESLSEPYFKYFESIENYKKPSGAFAELTPIYSNIRNGVGIWAGSSIARDTIQ
jgi:hypothetical protein